MKHLVLTLMVLLAFVACDERKDITVAVEPTDELIKKYSGNDFSIVLNDMNIKDVNGANKFEHQYNVLLVKNDSLQVDSLEWKTVNPDFFAKHENDLGMEIVTNHNGKLSRVAQPVGFGWAIGNEAKGSWEEVKNPTDSTRNNRRTWRPGIGSALFFYWMMRRQPTYRRDYNGYRNASQNNKPYYGQQAGNQSKYGTNSAFQKKARPAFYTRTKNSRTWSKYKSSDARNSGRSSRYKGGSSTRSRSGGIGK